MGIMKLVFYGPLSYSALARSDRARALVSGKLAAVKFGTILPLLLDPEGAQLAELGRNIRSIRDVSRQVTEVLEEDVKFLPWFASVLLHPVREYQASKRVQEELLLASMDTAIRMLGRMGPKNVEALRSQLAEVRDINPQMGERLEAFLAEHDSEGDCTVN